MPETQGEKPRVRQAREQSRGGTAAKGHPQGKDTKHPPPVWRENGRTFFDMLSFVPMVHLLARILHADSVSLLLGTLWKGGCSFFADCMLKERKTYFEVIKLLNISVFDSAGCSFSTLACLRN